ncbi:MAG: ATP-binding protein [Paracoccaceae bacterium]
MERGLTDAAFETLLSRLDRAPDNVMLRLAVIRRAVDLKLESRALDLAFDLTPDAVTASDDRKLVAGVFASAGLEEDAALWQDGAVAEVAAATPIAAALTAGADAAFDAVEAELEADIAEAKREAKATDPEPSNGENVVSLRLVGQDSDGTSDGVEEMTFADVGGLEPVKRDIERRIIAPFKQASLLSRFKKRSGGGVLMYGPPGCGKTMIARATAGECGARFQAVAISDILDPMWGVAEQKLSAIFEKARNATPTILFFDEIDALGAKRTGNVAAHVSQMVSHFLAEMDGVKQRNDGVLVLAATNIPWAMDGAFLRPGRFDRLFFVPPPDAPAREAILKLELAERPAVPGLDFSAITKATSGYSGADLAQIVEFAADEAIDATLRDGREVPINQAMLTLAAENVRASTSDWLTTARNHATYANESGRYDDVLNFLKKHGRS